MKDAAEAIQTTNKDKTEGVKYFMFRLFILTLFCLTVVSPSDTEPSESGTTRKYLRGETEQRILYTRDHSGTIELDINPRQGQSIKIGNSVFDQQTVISGFEIEIDKYTLTKDQSDNDFLEEISKIDSIVYKLSLDKEPLVADISQETILEVGASNKVTFTKHPNTIFMDFKTSEPIQIEEKQLKSPKRLDIEAHRIEIGNFVLDRHQNETEFLDTITKLSNILYKAKRNTV